MITDWINAFASVFASVGTVGAFIVGGALLRKEAARDRSRSEQERKAQASGVHAWVGSRNDITYSFDRRMV